MDQAGNPCTLKDPKVEAVLERLYREARGDELRSGWKLLPYLVQKLLGRKPSMTDQYHRMADLSIPVSAGQGTFAYLTARAIGARRIVEFGTSFGVSTIYFASAIRDNGGGMVIGSEFIESKVERARANILEAGLADAVEIRVSELGSQSVAVGAAFAETNSNIDFYDQDAIMVTGGVFFKW